MIKTFDSEYVNRKEEIIACKKTGSDKISVVIPTKNEAETIGEIIRSTLGFSEGTDFVDEVIVMDCSSDDGTAEIAGAAGAAVFDITAIHPDVEVSGKGAAMWKSQFVASGDIIVFLDADVRNFNERFIVGLAGALIEDCGLQMVKAAYRRPLIEEGRKRDDSGGRVTELFVRPLLNLLVPELSTVRQPLAGECAFRRTAMERLSFYSGYGVDIGLLLEQYFLQGIQSIAQVEMGVREHRNRTLQELSKMSFEIGGVLFSLLAKYDVCHLTNECNSVFSTWESASWRSYDLHNQVLPPAVLCCRESGEVS